MSSGWNIRAERNKRAVWEKYVRNDAKDHIELIFEHTGLTPNPSVENIETQRYKTDIRIKRMLNEKDLFAAS